MEDIYLYKLSNNDIVLATEENGELVKPHLVHLVPQESEISGKMNFMVRVYNYEESLMGLTNGKDGEIKKNSIIYKGYPNDDLKKVYSQKVTGIIIAPPGSIK